MQKPDDQVLELALELDYGERSRLSQELWWSLHPPAEDLPQEQIDAAWAAEIERRVAESDLGSVEMVCWEELEAELRAKLIKHSPGASRRLSSRPDLKSARGN